MNISTFVLTFKVKSICYVEVYLRVLSRDETSNNATETSSAYSLIEIVGFDLSHVCITIPLLLLEPVFMLVPDLRDLLLLLVDDVRKLHFHLIAKTAVISCKSDALVQIDILLQSCWRCTLKPLELPQVLTTVRRQVRVAVLSKFLLLKLVSFRLIQIFGAFQNRIVVCRHDG